MQKYKVRFDELSLYRIASLIENLKLNRKNRFTNTGLDEILIGSQFDEEIDLLYSEIETYIKTKLSSGFLGEIQEEGENYYKKKIVLKMRSYILVLTCTQLLKEKIIMVEDIQITT